MRIGAHVSIQGGLDNAPRNACEAGCECFQMFTRSPRGGPAKPITRALARRFRKACDEAEQTAWYIHTPYYVNLASLDARIRRMSVRIVREEMERGRAVGASAVMTHMGSAVEAGADAALERTVAGVRRVLLGYRGHTRLLVEIAAGSGSVLGCTFAELAAVVRATRGRCGVCLDTQHMFASGYDITSNTSVRDTVDDFDRVVGLQHLHLIHANDSKVPLASRKDRHEHIGKGKIGKRGFQALLSEPRLGGIDFVLETRLAGVAKDVRTLKSLRRRGA
jgi:deoxyribonuclease-4